mgnify:CR=1 FL=1
MLLAGIDLRTLGSRDLTYRRLSVLLHHSRPGSAFLRSLAGEDAEWSLTDHLLASVIDVLNAANWQRGGGKGSRPKPVSRPGVKDKGSEHFGTAVSIEELRRRLEVD